MQQHLSFLFGQDVKHFLVKDVEHPYEQVKPFHWFRGYQVGGRSLLWSRHCFRWSDLDFEANLKEGVGIDWPLRYADLAPWYDRVQAFIGISGEKAGLPQLPEGDLLPPFEMNCFERHLRQSIETSFPGRNLIMSHVAVLTRAPQRARRLPGPEPLPPRLSLRGLLLQQLLDPSRRGGHRPADPASPFHRPQPDRRPRDGPGQGRARHRRGDGEGGGVLRARRLPERVHPGHARGSSCTRPPTASRTASPTASGVLGHYLMDHTNAAGALGGYSGLRGQVLLGPAALGHVHPALPEPPARRRHGRSRAATRSRSTPDAPDGGGETTRRASGADLKDVAHASRRLVRLHGGVLRDACRATRTR